MAPIASKIPSQGHRSVATIGCGRSKGSFRPFQRKSGGGIRLLAGLFFCALLLGGISVPAYAQEKGATRTQIIADEENGTVTIVIDGRAVGMFDKDGLYVVGDIKYGGVMVDAGREHMQTVVDGRADKEKEGAPDETGPDNQADDQGGDDAQ